MGGLIGTATKEKDGLMSKKMATIEIEDWSSDEYFKYKFCSPVYPGCQVLS